MYLRMRGIWYDAWYDPYVWYLCINVCIYGYMMRMYMFYDYVLVVLFLHYFDVFVSSWNLWIVLHPKVNLLKMEDLSC